MAKNSNTGIDVKLLRSLYSASGVNKAALDYFAARENNSAETKVERMQQVLTQGGVIDAVRKDIVELFRQLDDAKCGEFLVGRRGHSSRFEWHVSLIDVGKAASGEMETVEALSEVEIQAAEAIDAQADHMEHNFLIRPDFRVQIKLPSNFTSSEALRLADFVRALPFNA